MTFRFGAASRVRYASSEVTAQRLLAYIVGYQRERGGVSPSFTDMQAKLGLASKSSVHRLMQILIAQRKIRMLPHRARAIEVCAQEVPGEGVDTVDRPKPLVDPRPCAYYRWDNETKALRPWEPQ